MPKDVYLSSNKERVDAGLAPQAPVPRLTPQQENELAAVAPQSHSWGWLKGLLGDVGEILAAVTGDKSEEEKAKAVADTALGIAQSAVRGLISKWSPAAGGIESLIFNAIKGDLEKNLTAAIEKELKAIGL